MTSVGSTSMTELIKKTYDDVQAALLNSEQEPGREIFTALCAVVEFADGEGFSKAQTRSLFEVALSRLKEAAPSAAAAKRPQCFGVAHSPIDPICAGGEDVSYADESGAHTRPPCDLFVSCGEAFSKNKVVPVKELLQKKRSKNKPQASERSRA